MKALILSCGTGGGHNDAGRGISEALCDRGHEAVFLNDYLSMAGERTDKLVCGLYVGSVSNFPPAFKAVYALGRGVSNLNRGLGVKSPVYYMNALMGKYLEQYLSEEQFDVVIMPHLFPAETLTRLRKKGVHLPVTVAVGTDYTSIPFWEETDCDYYVIPHEHCADDFVRRGIPKEKLLPLGIPAPLAYSVPANRQELRKKLGLQSDREYILVMGGSMGAGKMPALLRCLKHELRSANMDAGIVAVCGSNAKLYETLSAHYQGDNTIAVKSYLSNVWEYMKACDLLFTKPGGLSSTESALSRIPTVLLEPISGCETANRDFFVGHNMALCPRTTEEKARAGVQLLRSPEQLEAMRQAQEKTIGVNCALRLAETLERIVVNRDEWVG